MLDALRFLSYLKIRKVTYLKRNQAMTKSEKERLVKALDNVCARAERTISRAMQVPTVSREFKGKVSLVNYEQTSLETFRSWSALPAIESRRYEIVAETLESGAAIASPLAVYRIEKETR